MNLKASEGALGSCWLWRSSSFGFCLPFLTIESILDVRNDPHLPTTLNATKALQPTPQDMLFCTNDMCPIKVHWHIKLNYQEYWRVKLTITNRDISRNYTLWNLVAQHPNFQNFTESFSFSYRPLNGYGPTATSKCSRLGLRKKKGKKEKFSV